MQLDTVDVWKAFWRVFLIAASIIGLFWIGTANAATQCGPYGSVQEWEDVLFEPGQKS